MKIEIPLIKGSRRPISTYEELKDAMGIRALREYGIYALPNNRFLGESDLFIDKGIYQMSIKRDSVSYIFSIQEKHSTKKPIGKDVILLKAVNSQTNHEEILFKGEYKKPINIKDSRLDQQKRWGADKIFLDTVPSDFLEESTKIIFNKGKVKIGSKGKSRYQQPIELLEYFINKGEEVHWIEGIRIFDEWREIREDIYNLKSKFNGIISKLRGKKGFFNKNELNLKISSPENGFYKLIGLENCHSNIIVAKSLYEESLSTYKNNNFEEAKNKIVEAITIYREYISSLGLLIRLLPEVKFEETVKDDARRVLQSKIAVFERSIETTKYYINQLENKNWRNKWKDEKAREEFEAEIEIFYSNLESVFKNLKENFENLKRYLSGEEIFFKSDEEYKEIKKLIKEQNFIKLIKKDAIKDVLDVISRILNIQKYNSLKVLIYKSKKISAQNKRLEEVEARKRKEAEEILGEMLWDPERKKKLNFSKAPILANFKNYLIKNAFWMIKNSLKKSELTCKEERYLREFNNIKKELRNELKREPTDEEYFDALKKKKKVGNEYCEYIKLLTSKKSKLPFMEEKFKKKETYNNFEDGSDNSI